MFYRVEPTHARAGRMHAGAKTPCWHNLFTFKSYYAYNTDNWIELQVYPDAERAFLTGYGEAGETSKPSKFTEFDGLMEIESIVFGFDTWKSFIQEIQKERTQPYMVVGPMWKR